MKIFLLAFFILTPLVHGLGAIPLNGHVIKNHWRKNQALPPHFVYGINNGNRGGGKYLFPP